MKKLSAALLAALMLVGCSNQTSTEPEQTVEPTQEPEATAAVEETAGATVALKDNAQEAEYQIQVAMQYLLEEAYGDKVNDARIYVEKIYTAEEEQGISELKERNLGENEVAFEVRYELHPADGVDTNELTAATGEFDEESGWVVEKYNVGILRPNTEGTEPAYVITDFGTGF